MRKVIYKSSAIKFIIFMVMVIVLATLWPLRAWKQEWTIGVEPSTGIQSEVISGQHTLMQTFLSQGEHLETLRLYPGTIPEEGCFYLKVLNEKQQAVAKEQVVLSPDAETDYIDIPLELTMEAGKTYFLILQSERPKEMDDFTELVDVPSAEVTFAYEFITGDVMPGAGILYYDGEQIYGAGLCAGYDYQIPISAKRTLFYGGIVVIITVLLMLAVQLLFRKKNLDRLITVEQAFQWIANLLAGVFVLAGFVMIFAGKLSIYTLDNTFYAISLVLLAGLLFYAINHRREGQKEIFTKEYCREHVGDFLQMLFIAGAVAACCDYMSGLYNIHHQVAERREMLFFALVILSMCTFKELFNRYTLLYLVVTGIGGILYFNYGHSLLLVSDINEAEMGMNVEVLRNTIIIAILFGWIIIRTIFSLFRKKLVRPCYWMGGILLLFFALIVIFRNTRWWTVVLAVAFTLLYLSYGMWNHRERFLTNVLWGVIIHFLCSMGYALLHRPYVTYHYARYPFIFHTVTTTATYLTTVECAVIVLLLMKLYRTTEFREIYKELILFGVVSSYMLFTMARTGLFAVVLTGFAAWLIIVRGKGRERIRRLFVNLGLLVVAVIVMFPITFTLQRNIPGIVGQPRNFEIEEWPEQITRGHRLTSVHYMRIGRFVDVFADRVFGIPEGTFDFYGEIAEYRRTHNKTADTKLVASVSGIPNSIMVVFAEQEENLLPPEMRDKEDYSNGRLEIFKSYLEQLNLTGHDEMGATLPDGEIAVHAHNIYLQVAYDHGIVVGIVFVVFGVACFISAVIFYRKKKEEIAFAALPMIVILAFAIAGMVEWIFHLSSPSGFVLMMVIAPLFYKESYESDRKDEKAI